ncbi:DUF819 family protein [Phaeodactylibacter xiamenensis]|uniref:DUF819 family protein n=1 Tax=Phaeodactylibacter xiamenensis TaxID=1524460 RepID=UPI003CCB92D1
MPWILLQGAILLGVPFLSRRLARRGLLPDWLSPVVLCYAIGILLKNTSLFPLSDPFSTTATEVGILFAIPLLLYATDLKRWLSHAGSSVLSFGLCVLSGVVATVAAAYWFLNDLPDTWRLAGMLAGIYTGGTPNMQAIGLALKAPQETIILVNAADVLLGGVYLLLLTSVVPKWLKAVLPEFQHDKAAAVDETETDPYQAFSYGHAIRAIGLTMLVIGSALGLTWLVYGQLGQLAFLILMLTSLSLAVSFIPTVRNWENTFETGEYFLLIFCVALGMLADFQSILEKGLGIVQFTAVALMGTILLHLLLARLFRIDRDTFLFTSVAAIYGPPFIGQIASITGNRQLILSGIAMGLLGYAIGNYLGIGLAYLLQWLLQAYTS